MKKCENCKLKMCPEKCFNTHVGSVIALKKVARKLGKKIHIVKL